MGVGGHCGIAEQPWSKPGVYRDYVLSLAGGRTVEAGVTNARIRPALKPGSPLPQLRPQPHTLEHR